MHSKRKENAKGQGSIGKEQEEFYQTSKLNFQGPEGLETETETGNTKNEQKGLVKFKQ